MVKLETKLLEINDSNLVFIIEHKADLTLLNDLNLDIKVISKINETISLEKNTVLNFFFWEKIHCAA